MKIRLANIKLYARITLRLYTYSVVFLNQNDTVGSFSCTHFSRAGVLELPTYGYLTAYLRLALQLALTARSKSNHQSSSNADTRYARMGQNSV